MERTAARRLRQDFPAKLFVEAPIWGEVYFFSELNLFTREEGGPELQAGEVYLDAENQEILDAVSEALTP